MCGVLTISFICNCFKHIDRLELPFLFYHDVKYRTYDEWFCYRLQNSISRRNKPDKVHPLLSRKRPLVSCDSKQNVVKKMKMTVPGKIRSANDINKKPKSISEVGKKFAHNQGKALVQARTGQELLSDKINRADDEPVGREVKSPNVKDCGDEITMKGPSESVCEIVEEKESAADAKKSTASAFVKDRKCEGTLAAIEEEHEGTTPNHEEENETAFAGEAARSSSPVPKVIPQDRMKDPLTRNERFAAFSFCETQKQKSTSSKRDVRRKTVCLTQSYSSKSNVHHRMTPENRLRRPYSTTITTNNGIPQSYQKTPVRANASRIPPNSAPSRRNEMSFTKQSLARDKQQNATSAAYTTPLKRFVDSLPANSALKASPRRPVSSARKPNKSNASPVEKPKQPKPPRPTLSNNTLSKLPPNSLLRSAPLRRSRSYRQSMSTAAANVAPKTPSSNIQRRKTFHFASERPDSTPICQPPFTPRGEWQNKELSIRYYCMSY